MLQVGALAGCALLMAIGLLEGDAPFARWLATFAGDDSAQARPGVHVPLLLPLVYAAFFGIAALAALPLLSRRDGLLAQGPRGWSVRGQS